jgi:glycosyltransferase involved in cell wall biosynthesis
MITTLFIGSILLIIYAYFGYPLSLAMIRLFRSKTINKSLFYPSLTIIIAAHNEEKMMQRKIENTLRLVYPKEKLQVIVASDGSTDRTNDIIRSYGNAGIQLLELMERKGKENAQKAAVRRAGGDILVFSDAATMLDPEGLQHIASNFSDPSVGCVSSEDRVMKNDGNPGGENLYVRYEMWLRRLESKVNSLVGMSGSFFAARKEVCEDFSGEMQSDFRTVLNSIKLGLRAVSDPEVIGYYRDVDQEKQEFDRKVRTVVRGLTVFFRHLQFLNVLKYGLFSYQYFCHKLLRWLVPALLLAAFMANLILAMESNLFLFLFLGQVFFYALGIWGYLKTHAVSKPFLKIPAYFLLVNISIALAWIRYLKGQRVVIWKPTER